MGALTFSQMQTLVKRTINNRSDLDTEVAQAINNAYIQTSMIRGVTLRELDGGPATFNTVVGTPSYSFATILTTARNVMAVFSPLRDTTNSRKIRSTSIQDIDAKTSASQGKPSWFAHFGSGLVLNPTPDGVYTISMRYRLRPTQLSLSGDLSVLPEEFDWPIIWGAATDLNAAIGVLDKSSFYATKRRESLEIITLGVEVEDEYADFSIAPDLS